MSNPEWNRRYRERHPDRVRASARRWVEKNRARVSEIDRRWRTAAKTAASNAARRFGEKVHWSVFERLFLLPCFSCGAEPANGVDHVIPRTRGGRNIVDNLQPACLACNVHKGTKVKIEEGMVNG